MFHSFSIITTVYKKQNEIGHFLNAFINQTYQGRWEIICVVDKSPDRSLDIIKQYADRAKDRNVDLVVIENDKTSGNCVSRNKGVEISKNDILIILDSDCIPSSDYLHLYNHAYSFNDCDVAIGPFNIETNGADPQNFLRNIKAGRHRGNIHEHLQDTVNRRSFLNTVTRNFTIKRSFLLDKFKDEALFDPAFSHLATDPSTGFGWEDIEMGYRLYKKGARIKYVAGNPTVHMSHPPAIENASSIPPRSMLNFRRMLDKHPEMFAVARPWVIETVGKIYAWERNNGHNPDRDQNYLRIKEIFGKDYPYKYKTLPKKRLRILTYVWHVGHQYELHKLPHDFVLVSNAGTDHSSAWYYTNRPFPDNDTLRKFEEINQKDYDLAIVHFDENCLSPEHTNNVLCANWGASMRMFMERVHLPKVAVCHGTPQFYGQYTNNINQHYDFRVIEESRKKLVDYMRDTLVVCNSHQAEREWGFAKSKCIWHGFDPAEYPLSTYSKKVTGLLHLSGRPHYRGHKYLANVCIGLPDELRPQAIVPEEPIMYGNRKNNEYAYAKFRNYIDAIRQYTLYFNPTLRSPMPRSRTEAMMCGLITVSVDNHDVSMFIENGVNGFYSNSVDELVNFIVSIFRSESALKDMASRSRKTAVDIFHNDRYLSEWQSVLNGI